MKLRNILLIILTQTLQADECFKLIIGSIGAKITQLSTLERYQYTNNQNKYQDYQLTIDNLYGWDATLFPFMKINRLLLPWGMVNKRFSPYGKGFIKEVTTENDLPTATSFKNITASSDITSYNIGNAFELITSTNKDLYIFLGYNRQHINVETNFNLTTGSSQSLWKGFAGGIGLFLRSSHKLSGFISGFVFPDKISIQTTGDNLLELPGYQSYRLMEYLFNGIIYYQADDNSFIGLSGSFFYDHNVGKATIIMSETKKNDLTNPQLIYLKASGITISMVLKYSF